MRKGATAVLVAVFTALAFVPDYEEPVKIYAAGVSLQVTGGYANPFVTDWNGDGLKDLIVGEKGPQPDNNGRIRFYENTGSNQNPVFGASVFMEAGGEVITLYAD